MGVGKELPKNANDEDGDDSVMRMMRRIRMTQSVMRSVQQL